MPWSRAGQSLSARRAASTSPVDRPAGRISRKCARRCNAGACCRPVCRSRPCARPPASKCARSGRDRSRRHGALSRRASLEPGRHGEPRPRRDRAAAHQARFPRRAGADAIRGDPDPWCLPQGRSSTLRTVPSRSTAFSSRSTTNPIPTTRSCCSSRSPRARRRARLRPRRRKPTLRDGPVGPRTVRTLEGPVVGPARGAGRSVVAMPMAGARGLVDALRGSTTERVVREASCPVLALPVAR